VDHIPVHIGANVLKRTLYDAIIPKWNTWTDNFPLRIDEIMMRDKLWIILNPTTPDRDAIAKNFFKPGKKGVQIFKTGKTLINFHILNEVYGAMLEKKADDESRVEQRLTIMDSEIEHLPSDAADFTVCGFVQLSAILY